MASKHRKTVQPIIGVLALQGDFIEHIKKFDELGYEARPIRTIAEAMATSGLVIPGGESTTIGKLLRSTKLDSWIIGQAKKGYPIYGTCAGCVLIAKQVDSEYSLKLIDITAKRNAYGNQLNSFEVSLYSDAFPEFPGVFIRAPKIIAVGNNVATLIKHESTPVLVKENNIMAGTFHPELSDSTVIHEFFVKMISKTQ